MRTVAYIFILVLILDLSVPCALYSHCCLEEVNILNLVFDENSSDEDNCKGCSPLTQCGDCISWFITQETFVSSQNTDLKIRFTTFKNETEIRFPQKIFQPPKV